MPVIKSPTRLPKNETIQLRVPQDIKFRLERYAEFIHATPSYVVAETLARLFRKDAEFQTFLTSYESQNPDEVTADVSMTSSDESQGEAVTLRPPIIPANKRNPQ